MWIFYHDVTSNADHFSIHPEIAFGIILAASVSALFYLGKMRKAQ